ncbi:hypothetical protein SLEP1_g58604 [Rubroshorea leprosula]|uniref:BRX domain-containing protein n=1 Tax=Rubroshorea leprosula TaxID=152421 RepID=A0AAV5MQU9_9ROSI|nr:hypothetical protein SLEP1_g58604 [Rubroshorea leprosula]
MLSKSNCRERSVEINYLHRCWDYYVWLEAGVGSNPNKNHTTSLISRESESKGDSGNGTISHGTKALNEKSEWMVHDEPGVYLTLSSLPGGGNELKRVRFSRKHFTEEQAEKWWAENGPKVCKRHNILGGD